MRLFRPFFLTRWLFAEAVFRLKSKEKVLCLTFDDGPNPASTPELLSILDKHKVKALFFCSGREAGLYPDLVDSINQHGHAIGNHGFDHISGFRTLSVEYCNNVDRAAKINPGIFFRPPYGHLTIKQYKELKKKYKIILWDVMPYDFDINYGAENSLLILKRKLRSGSVIVLHDKPQSTVAIFLEDFLKHAAKEGYRFILP